MVYSKVGHRKDMMGREMDYYYRSHGTDGG